MLEPLSRKTLKLNTTIAGILPQYKWHSIRWTAACETNKILNAEWKILPQICFMVQDDNWVRSNMMLDKRFYLQLVKYGNENFAKSTYLFLKQFLQNHGKHNHHPDHQFYFHQCHHYYQHNYHYRHHHH